METTASGLLHMAYMDKEDLRKVLSKEIEIPGSARVVNPYSDLDATLSQIRSKGYIHVENSILQEQSFAFKVTDGFRILLLSALFIQIELKTLSSTTK